MPGPPRPAVEPRSCSTSRRAEGSMASGATTAAAIAARSLSQVIGHLPITVGAQVHAAPRSRVVRSSGRPTRRRQTAALQESRRRHAAGKLHPWRDRPGTGQARAGARRGDPGSARGATGAAAGVVDVDAACLLLQQLAVRKGFPRRGHARRSQPVWTRHGPGCRRRRRLARLIVRCPAPTAARRPGRRRCAGAGRRRAGEAVERAEARARCFPTFETPPDAGMGARP